MNLANALANTFLGGYQALEKAGWRRGYAADCKSVREISKNTNVFSGMSLNGHSAKNPGQTGNESGISQTLSGWWLIPAALLGAAIWALLIVEVMG